MSKNEHIYAIVYPLCPQTRMNSTSNKTLDATPATPVIPAMNSDSEMPPKPPRMSRQTCADMFTAEMKTSIRNMMTNPLWENVPSTPYKPPMSRQVCGGFSSEQIDQIKQEIVAAQDAQYAQATARVKGADPSDPCDILLTK